MADKVKESTVLNIECLFSDGDTRTITLKNPRSDISQSEIENLERFMQDNNILIGDRAGSDFMKIKRVVRRRTTTIYLDLN